MLCLAVTCCQYSHILEPEVGLTDPRWHLPQNFVPMRAYTHISSYVIFFATLLIQNPVAAQQGEERPDVVVIPAEGLVHAKMRLASGDEALQVARDSLIARASRALEVGPFSVMDKTKIPPSGDKHDYTSYGPYWWPDPSRPDGLPYIRRDGEVNPETVTGATDRTRFEQLTDAVFTLALAYYFTADERYAGHASHLIRVWFLDPETRMNPHLEYGQAIPGRIEGRYIGIIDTAKLSRIVDAVGLIVPSASWTDEDDRGIRQWFSDYLQWLLTSAHGINEQRYFNNHATWYDVQTAALALATGKDDVARAIIENSRRWRLSTQIAPDGSQPHEMARTRPLAYSTMNLQAMFHLATMGDRFSLDLWNAELDNGGNLKHALDFLVEALRHQDSYRNPGVREFHPVQALPVLLMGRNVWADPRYDEAIARIPADELWSDPAQLLYSQAP